MREEGDTVGNKFYARYVHPKDQDIFPTRYDPIHHKSNKGKKSAWKTMA